MAPPSNSRSRYWNAKGYAQMLQGNLDTAREFFEKAIAEDPGFSEVKINMATLDMLVKHRETMASRKVESYRVQIEIEERKMVRGL